MPLNFGRTVAAGLKSRAVVVASTGNNAFITAVGGKRIHVHYAAIQAKEAVAASVTIKFFDTAGTPAQIANSPEWVLDPDNREGLTGQGVPIHDSMLFVGAVGMGVQVNLSAAVSVMVHIVYSEVS